MGETKDIREVYELIEDIEIAMLTTGDVRHVSGAV